MRRHESFVTVTQTYTQVEYKNDVSFANPKIENISGESM